MDQIKTNIQGENYILVEVPILKNNNDEIISVGDKYQCIYTGIKEVSAATFWNKAIYAVKLLVPEKNIVKFNNHKR